MNCLLWEWNQRSLVLIKAISSSSKQGQSLLILAIQGWTHSEQQISPYIAGHLKGSMMDF